jgi:hypothetical protein
MRIERCDWRIYWEMPSEDRALLYLDIPGGGVIWVKPDEAVSPKRQSRKGKGE